ncbi:malectin domain-containing carbohydrate-binding protein [Catalinimonas alkaloidigena]|nr:malectin domain-containing carbohydrate-binding protein [Catalinimonas alkaloidigena]
MSISFAREIQGLPRTRQEAMPYVISRWNWWMFILFAGWMFVSSAVLANAPNTVPTAFPFTSQHNSGLASPTGGSGGAAYPFWINSTSTAAAAEATEEIRINFGDAANASVTGYLPDFGQAYGDRGNGYTYGWISTTTGAPVSLEGQGRRRTNTSDARLATLIHMDHPSTPPTGYWELALPNGTYQVTVAVGDGNVSSTPEIHRINAEGITLIDNFAPSGGSGAATRFTTGIGQVEVVDGKLTLDYAGGGKNTKLTYVEVLPVAANAGCTPLSPLACDELIKPLPFSLAFDGTEGGLSQTGFTLVDAPSARLAADGPISNPDVPGYEPGRLSFEAGNLVIEADKGLAYVTNETSTEVNSQINALGVAFTAGADDFELTTRVVNPYEDNSSNAEQAGVWLGKNEDNFVRLVVVNKGVVEMRVEVNGISERTDAIKTNSLGSLANRTVTLRLAVEGDKFVGYYTLDAGTEVRLGELPVGAGLLDGLVIDGKPVTLGGVYASKRREAAATTVRFRFADFNITSKAVERPYVISSTPTNGATNVDIRDLTISANNLYFPTGYRLISSTATAATVQLYRLNGAAATQVAGDVNDTGGGDALNFNPSAPLQTNTRYRFVVTDGVKAVNDAGEQVSFLPYSAEFTTGSDEITPPVDLAGVSFTRVTDFGGNELLDRFTSLLIGPDGKLYGSTLMGSIKRWNIQPDGSLTNYEELRPTLTGSRLDFQGTESRAIIGLAFDPRSTASNLIAYITHSKLINFEIVSSDSLNWDGKITRLSGPNLNQVQDLVIHLPRSRKDHLTNSIAFKPGENNVLYFNQGSNSAAGEVDNNWKKPERLLAGAVLRLDLDKLPANLPLDVRTTNNIRAINDAPATGLTLSDGTYNPYSQDAPLTIFGSGVRNAYDLVWHSNGQLYVPANGTAGGSNAPASANYVSQDPTGRGVRRPDGTFYNHTDFPMVPAATGNEVQKDWLFRIVQGGYYGHPNPYRGEFVLNHGGAAYSNVPGQTATHTDVANYPTTLGPDANYREPAFDFNVNKSPNGVIEYKSDAFGGKLKGMLVVCRFSNGSDLILLQPNGTTYDIANSYLNVPGLTGLDDPLELVEDPNTGNLYVSEYDRSNDGVARLTLLKANVAPAEEPQLVFTPQSLSFEAKLNGTAEAKSMTLAAFSGSVNASDVTLTASENWITLPGTVTLGSAMPLGVDVAGLASGQYTGQVVASAPGFTADTLLVNLTVTQELTWAYQINFQDAATTQVPEGYLRDNGAPLGVRQGAYQGDGSLYYGWVTAGTTTPASNEAAARNRGVASASLLVNTLTHMRHPSPDQYPHRDWVIELPNGSYRVNVSVGDPSGDNNSKHTVYANGVLVVSFDEAASVAAKTGHIGEGSADVEVTNGLLVLTGGSASSNTKPNYVRIAPLNSLKVPSIAAIFSGTTSAPDVYRGSVEVKLEATDFSGKGIASLAYSLNGTDFTAYTTPVTFNQPGSYTLTARAQDNAGKVGTQTFTFKVEAASGAMIAIENMTKVPGTNTGFPANDYYTFHRINDPVNEQGMYTNVRDQNVMRVHNTGTAPLVISSVQITDQNRFKLVAVNGTDVTSKMFPLTVQTGQYTDLTFRFVEGKGAKGLYTEKVSLVSNADNSKSLEATLRGAYMVRTSGFNEVPVQDVFYAFGFQSSLNGVLHPSSDYPVAADVDAGVHGDLVLSKYFVQADPSQPVRGLQLASMQEQGSVTTKLIYANSNSTIGGFSFTYDGTWQTLLPKSNYGSEIAGDMASSISQPFRISIAGYNTGGSYRSAGNGYAAKELLGVRVYKVIDRDGKVIPYHYIAIQDYIGSGCDIGSGNCDWQDNVVYLTNIKPATDPSVQAIPDTVVKAKSEFRYNVARYFDKGYPGNKLTYSVEQLPTWLRFDGQTGGFRGTAPLDAAPENTLTVKATDVNGMVLTSTFTIRVDAPLTLTALGDREDELFTAFENLEVVSVTGQGQKTYAATNLPEGLTLDAQTGLINGALTKHATYAVTVTVTSSANETASATFQWVVTDVAVVANAGDDRTVLDADHSGAEAVTLQGEGSYGDSLTYSWSENGTEIATGVNPTVTLTLGEHLITLTATNAEGISDTDEVKITVVAKPVYNVTLLTEGEGTVTPQSGSYEEGAEVTLQATAAEGYVFAGWSGDASGNSNPLVLAVTKDLTITARFVPVSSAFAVRLNAGGPDLLWEGMEFTADASTSFVTSSSSTYSNTNINAPALYQTERVSAQDNGTLTYAIPVANGRYTVRTHHAELWFGHAGDAARADQRVFDIYLENNLVENDLDMYLARQANPSTDAVVRTFQHINVTDGVLDLRMVASRNRPTLAGVEVIAEAITVPTALWLEAECATAVGGNWVIGTDRNASNGTYASIKDGFNTLAQPPADVAANRLRFEIDMENAGAYHLFARVSAPNDASNSFWVRINGGSWIKWWEGLNTNGGFAWREVVDGPFDLHQGKNTIDFAYREAGTLLDKLYLSNEGQQPTGLGDDASNCVVVPNEAPVAEAGMSMRLNDEDFNGLETAVLNGSGSRDADGEIVRYSWQKDGVEIATGITATVQLGVGTHQITLVVTDNRGATATDQVEVVVVQPERPQTTDVWLEAECAQMGSNWRVSNDNGASNGKYAAAKEGLNSWFWVPSRDSDLLTFNFQVSEAKEYNFFIRVKAPRSSSNSFYARLNGGRWTLLNLSTNANFVWRSVGSAGLNAGNNTLEIAYREDGTLLDKIYITASNQTPSGYGEGATNCGSPAAKVAQHAPASAVTNTVSSATAPAEEQSRVTTAAAETAMPTATSVYPNPSRGRFQVAFDGSTPTQGKLTVISTTGVILQQVQVESGNWEINLESQATGVYLLRIEFGDQVQHQRIQKL